MPIQADVDVIQRMEVPRTSIDTPLDRVLSGVMGLKVANGMDGTLGPVPGLCIFLPWTLVADSTDFQ